MMNESHEKDEQVDDSESNDNSSDDDSTRQPSKVLSVGNEVEIFVHHINSLATTFPLTTALIHAVHDGSYQEYRKFIDKNLETRVEGDSELITISADHLHEFNRLNRERERGSIAARIVPRSLLVSLVSQFDYFLGRLIRTIYFLRPEFLNGSDRSLSCLN